MVTEEGRAKEAEERNRTALSSSASGTRTPRRTSWEKAKDAKSSLTMAGTIAPWILGIVGLILSCWASAPTAASSAPLARPVHRSRRFPARSPVVAGGRGDFRFRCFATSASRPSRARRQGPR